MSLKCETIPKADPITHWLQKASFANLYCLVLLWMRFRRAERAVREWDVSCAYNASVDTFVAKIGRETEDCLQFLQKSIL